MRYVMVGLDVGNYQDDPYMLLDACNGTAVTGEIITKQGDY